VRPAVRVLAGGMVGLCMYRGFSKANKHLFHGCMTTKMEICSIQIWLPLVCACWAVWCMFRLRHWYSDMVHWRDTTSDLLNSVVPTEMRDTREFITIVVD
jgi:hypothetical protein